MRSILLIVAGIALIILVIKKCSIQTNPDKQIEKRRQHSKIIKNAYKVFPEEFKLWHLYY
jgi:hypothetical protein